MFSLKANNPQYALAVLCGGANRTTVGDAAYSVASSDHIIAHTSVTAVPTVTLPTAASIDGCEYMFKDETGSAAIKDITITTTSTQMFDGAPTKAINTNYGLVRVYSNGSN